MHSHVFDVLFHRVSLSFLSSRSELPFRLSIVNRTHVYVSLASRSIALRGNLTKAALI